MTVATAAAKLTVAAAAAPTTTMVAAAVVMTTTVAAAAAARTLTVCVFFISFLYFTTNISFYSYLLHWPCYACIDKLQNIVIKYQVFFSHSFISQLIYLSICLVFYFAVTYSNGLVMRGLMGQLSFRTPVLQ